MKRILMYILLFTAITAFILIKRDEMMGIAAALLLVSVFSALLSPVCTWFENRGMRPSLAALLTVGAFLLIAMLIIAACIPYLAVQSVHLVKRLSPIASMLLQHVSAWTEETGFLRIYRSSTNVLSADSFGRLTAAAAKFSINAAAQTGRIAFSLVLTYYVLCDRRRLANHILLFVPISWRKAVLVGLHGCRNAVFGYFSGTLKTSAFISAATTLGLMLLGVEDAVLLGVIMGLFEILPYIGPVAAAIPILLSSLSQGLDTALGALLLVVVVQQIEGSIVSPYFTASSTSVHPLAAIVGVFVLGSLFGIWGILTAVPLIAVGQSIVWSLQRTWNMMREEDAG